MVKNTTKRVNEMLPNMVLGYIRILKRELSTSNSSDPVTLCANLSLLNSNRVLFNVTPGHRDASRTRIIS